MGEPGLLAKYVVDTGFFSDLWTSEGSHHAIDSRTLQDFSADNKDIKRIKHNCAIKT